MPASLGAVVAIFAVVVFAVSHSVFFWFVGGREVERAVLRKTAVLTLLRESLVALHRPADALRLDAYVARCGERASHALGPAEADERESHNLRRIGRWIGPLLALLTAALVATIVYNVRSGRRLTYAHWIGLLLALFGYVPELLVYVLGSEHYSILRDDELVAVAWGLPIVDPK